MNLTKEQLEMLKRLKPAIDKYMGDWQEGDWYLYGKEPEIPFEVEANIFRDNGRCTAELRMYQEFDVLRIPSFCTPDGKRCLAEMLTDKGKEYLYEYYHTSITILLRSNDYYTAILKALIIQEGV